MRNIQIYSIKAFTLVELIVVITILALLATIAFISFQGYTESSRDSVRLSDMANIEKGFNLMLAKDQKLPVPEDKIDITASGTVITYQGYAGQKVLGILSVNGEGKDPLDNVYYTYATNPARNKYQLLGFFENNTISYIHSSVYADLSERYPRVRGFELGILTDTVTKEPVQKVGNTVDIVNATNEYKAILNNSQNGILSGTGGELAKMGSYNEKFKSCKTIIDTYGYGIHDGIYNINPNGSEEFKVYCDMTTDEGGWTLVFTAGNLKTIDIGTLNAYFPEKLTTLTMGAKLSDQVINDIYTNQFRTTTTAPLLLTKKLYAKLVENKNWNYTNRWYNSEHIKTSNTYNNIGNYSTSQGLRITEGGGNFVFNHWGTMDVWFKWNNHTRYDLPCCGEKMELFLWIK